MTNLIAYRLSLVTIIVALGACAQKNLQPEYDTDMPEYSATTPEPAIDSFNEAPPAPIKKQRKAKKLYKSAHTKKKKFKQKQQQEQLPAQAQIQTPPIPPPPSAPPLENIDETSVPPSTFSWAWISGFGLIILIAAGVIFGRRIVKSRKRKPGRKLVFN
jgi:hypothetical protein